MNAQKILIRYLHYRGELGKGLSRSEVTWGPLSGKKKKKKKKALAESFNVNSRAPEWPRGT